MRYSLKIFSLLLCMVLTFSLAACGGDGGETSSDVSSQPKTTYFDGSSTVNLAKDDLINAAKTGKITVMTDDTTTFDVNLGDTTETLFATSKMNFNDYQNDDFVYYDNGRARIFFKNDENTKGCIAVSTFSTAYNFEPGIMNKNDVLNIMGKADVEGETPQQLLKLFFGEKGTFCAYRAGDNTVGFFFGASEILSCIILSQNNNWIY